MALLFDYVYSSASTYVFSSSSTATTISHHVNNSESHLASTTSTTTSTTSTCATSATLAPLHASPSSNELRRSTSASQKGKHRRLRTAPSFPDLVELTQAIQSERPVNGTGTSNHLPSKHAASSGGHGPSGLSSPSVDRLAKGKTPAPRSDSTPENDAAHLMIEEILRENDLYKVLGLKDRDKKGTGNDQIRRAYIGRCRICHPDKLPNHPLSTTAFQKLSYAYEILSKPSSRRLYDLTGTVATPFPHGSSPPSSSSTQTEGSGMGPQTAPTPADETLNGVLWQMWGEFMEGDFEMVRVLVNALNEGSPALTLGEEAIENLEGILRRIRNVLLASQKYFRVIKFELIRLYEIQHSLRQLSYFNLTGRLRLTLQLARVTLSIPMAIDQAMKEGDGDGSDDESDEGEDGEGDEDDVMDGTSENKEPSTSDTSSTETNEGSGVGRKRKKKRSSDGGADRSKKKRKERRGILGRRTAGLLTMAVGVLERGEKII